MRIFKGIFYVKSWNEFHKYKSLKHSNFELVSFEPSLTAEACNNMEELGLIERKTENQENHK